MRSNIPFIENKWYGKSDFEMTYLNASDSLINEDFWLEYLRSNDTKYSQGDIPESLSHIKFKKPRHRYDGFIVGQLKYDTSIVLIDKKHHSSEDMAFEIATSNPDKMFCYKPHPKTYELDQINDLEKLLSLENVDIVFDPIHKLFNRARKVYCISSTVGIEAVLYGKSVEFLGNIWYGNIIPSEKNKIKLMNSIYQNCIPFQAFD